MAATMMLRRFATAPPSVLLERTQKNVVAFAKTGPAPTRSIRRRVEEEASQVRRKYLLEVAAKDAERVKAVEARKVSLAKEAEARAALRETQKAERQQLFEERERLRLAAKTDVVSERSGRRAQREELQERRRAHVLADLESTQPVLASRDGLDVKLREFMGRKMTYDRGLFPE